MSITIGQVAPMGIGPVGSAGVVEAKTEQEGLQPRLGILESKTRCVTCATQVAYRLVLDRRNVHRGEVSGAQKPGDLHGIAPVVLDLVAGALRDQRRCNDQAVESLVLLVAVQDIAAWTGLVGEHQVGGLAVQPANQLVDVGLAGANGTDEVGRLTW